MGASLATAVGCCISATVDTQRRADGKRKGGGERERGERRGEGEGRGERGGGKREEGRETHLRAAGGAH